MKTIIIIMFVLANTVIASPHQSVPAITADAQKTPPMKAHPIIDVPNGYLGASTSGRWLTAQQSANLLQQGLEFRIFSLTAEVGTAISGKPYPSGICPEIHSLPLTPEYEDGVIGIVAPWNPLPRAARAADKTEPAYADAVRTYLIGAGIENPKIEITQALHVDLDGTGEEQVLISATNYFAKTGERPDSAVPGSYSGVLLRRIISDKVETQLVVGEVYPAKAFIRSSAPIYRYGGVPNWYDVSAVLDLDGDGKLEVVVHSEYSEGGETGIFRCTPTKVEKLLSLRCGG
jgi:hypothetical protein